MTAPEPPPVLDLAPGSTQEVTAAHDGTGTTRLRRLDTVAGAGFKILVWDFPPGTSEGAHHHGDEPVGVEQYLVLHGRIRIVVDGAVHDLTEGDSIAIARRSVRETRNDGDAPARVLLVFESLNKT
ncbi:cupin domain-containing protein [Nonomuraea bangladeshensis]|uniref:cupin domain-containing protein n=1 Tax=Nonomuraea bangladeshensis TaxID=404385 RepID=UPI0031CFB757